ncbi:MAG: hypothetical protein OEY67_04905 [Gammaproteobacteria bacterium]|nr:hypothetical protein [Gammaproteobacteria bacterium]
MSFLISLRPFRQVITDDGFAISAWNDKTELASKAFAGMSESKGEPDLPELGEHLLAIR